MLAAVLLFAQVASSTDQPTAGGICEIDPSACPKQGDIQVLARRPLHTDLVVPKPEEEPTREVSVRSKPPARSASDWDVDEKTLRSAPKSDGADAMLAVPGVFVTERGLLGRAPRLSLRGFEGTSGQDVEIFVANIPLNQASNIRAPGYADMRLVMPEILRTVRINSGPYDPRQGDFAVAGSVHMDVGLAKRGFTGKGTAGSFGTRRVFLGFAPDDPHWKDSFAAFEAFGIDGPGDGRAGERTSFVGQLAFGKEDVQWRGVVAIGSARFDFPGYIRRDELDRGEYAYRARHPLGRDRSNAAHIGSDIVWSIGEGTLTLGAFASKTKMAMRQDLTRRDDYEQVNDSSTLGLHTAYKRNVKLLSKRDLFELGTYARLDTIEQTDTRLFPDATRDGPPRVDATISATNLAAYLDAYLYPIKRVVVRGGTRLDSLAYSVKDRAGNDGIERTSQGFRAGNKITVDYAAGGGAHLVASYGEGFRSPQARTLREGDRVPFATVRSTEAGVRVKTTTWRGSLVGFASWLDQDRVFEPTLRENVPAPPSRRVGAATALAAHAGIVTTAFSATYTHAVFTGADSRFRDGDPVPYAPRLVVRSDASIADKLTTLCGKPVVGKLGAGIEGAVERYLPLALRAQNALFVDALASASWREFELGISGTNLLSLGYFDAQYLIAGAQHVLVAPPTMVLMTLEIHIEGRKSNDGYESGQ